MTTRQVFRLAKRHLGPLDMPSRMRYSLKEAIYALGPSGFPFERFVARLLEAEGYTTEVGAEVMGRCVRHEVDVVARRGRETVLVECKFHGQGDRLSSVKTALYVRARCDDLREALAGKAGGDGSTFSCMLVTNTRFSSDAVRYAECAGLRIVGWKHPRTGSLERMIDAARTYPVTVLPAVTRRVAGALVAADLVLARDLVAIPEGAIAARTGLDRALAGRMREQALRLCPPAQ
jgi:hypothetical protein